MKGKIPVTIITGFLGAGKTTLINNLIKKHPVKKFAIIENEFGEIGLDGSFIIGADENIFELSNGCICCSLNADFYELINKLQTGGYDFNHLLIETTGIADPTSIVNAFLSDYEIIERFTIDAVVCLADAVNIEDLIDSEPEARKQLTIADIILLNKIDLVRQGYCDGLISRIQNFNQLATIYPTSQADISQLEILDTHQYLGRKIEQSVSSFKNLAFLGNNNPKHDIKSIGISIPGDLDYERFRFWFETILFFAKYRPYRVKGILSFKDVPEKCILHAIKDNYVFDRGDLWQQDEERYCKLVFIGRNLDNLEIEEKIYQLRAE